jgi:hypothetical protein
MSKGISRIHITITDTLRSQLEDICEVQTGRRNLYSQTINSLLSSYASTAHAQALEIKAARQDRINAEMAIGQ